MKLLMIKFLNSHKKKLKIKVIKRKKNLKNCCAFISVFYCNTIAFSSFFSFLNKANFTSRFKLFDMFSWIKCDSHRTICRCGMSWTWNRMSCAGEMVTSSHKKNTRKLNIWYGICPQTHQSSHMYGNINQISSLTLFCSTLDSHHVFSFHFTISLHPHASYTQIHAILVSMVYLQEKKQINMRVLYECL